MNDLVIGIDFAGPRTASQQRKKLVGIAATRIGDRRYLVTADGFNTRLFAKDGPGWTADTLAEALAGPARARVVALDFPFSLPAELLTDASFGQRVGRSEPFGTWAAFNRFVCERLPVACPLDYTPLAGWRDKTLWKKRATDVVAGGQPPLKHQFQVIFNMTLLGNALLGRLAAKGAYRVDPFDGRDDGRGVMIEIYPGFTMRRLGRPDYKRDPVAAIDTVLGHCAGAGVAIEIAPAVRAVCETYGVERGDPDASDALIALCTGILYREGLCEPAISPEHRESHWPLEGAVWGPRLQA